MQTLISLIYNAILCCMFLFTSLLQKEQKKRRKGLLLFQKVGGLLIRRLRLLGLYGKWYNSIPQFLSIQGYLIDFFFVDLISLMNSMAGSAGMSRSAEQVPLMPLEKDNNNVESKRDHTTVSLEQELLPRGWRNKTVEFIDI